MANWEAFNSNLRDIGSTLGERIREETKRKRDMEDALMMISMKAQAEQLARQQDPMYQAVIGAFDKFRPRPAVDTTGTTETGEIVGVQRGQAAQDEYEFMRSFNIGKEGVTATLKPELTPQAQLRQKRREQEQSQEIKSKVPTVQQKNDLLNAKQQVNNIDKMESLAENVPSGWKGIVGIGVSSLTRGSKETNTRLYLKEMPAFAVSLYRALTGDTRLSDADAAARAYPLLWHPSEDSKIKTKSFANIKKALRARIKLIESGRYQQTSDGQFITPLEDIIAEVGIDKYKEEEKEDFSNLWE